MPAHAMPVAEFGGHSADCPTALTLFEVGALLARGANAAGCEIFSEFPEAPTAGRKVRRLDFIWAVRATAAENDRRWIPVAAFEVEGLDVPADSVANDLGRFREVARGEPLVAAVVLYRTTETGWLFWRPGRNPGARQAELVAAVRRHVEADPIPGVALDVVVDNELLDGGVLGNWVAIARERITALRQAGRTR